MKSGPRFLQLEKALAQKRRPNTAKNKLIKKNNNNKCSSTIGVFKKKNILTIAFSFVSHGWEWQPSSQCFWDQPLIPVTQMQATKACMLRNYSSISDQYIKAPLKSAYYDGLVQAAIPSPLDLCRLVRKLSMVSQLIGMEIGEVDTKQSFSVTQQSG